MIEVCPQCRTAHDPAATGGPCPRCSLAGALADSPSPAATDDYEFVAELGRGGMGVVSLARQRSLDRLVALKVIAGPSDAGPAGARLLREARAAAAINHPHVVAVHEVGQGGAGAFIAMEYCEGGDLRAQLRRGPLAPRAAAELGRKLADAIVRAHAAGVLHRDLKPSNVLLSAAGEPKLADFGLSGAVSGSGSEHTRPGLLGGSPSYLAPELLAGGAATPAIDVYGLGAVLYECVTGRPPFTGESPEAVFAQIGAVEPVTPRRLSPGLPADLDTIILKCLEKNPAARYATAGALRDDLDHFLAGRPIAARPVSPLGRLGRWARRNPALATTNALALGLLLTVAVGSSVATLRLRHAQALTAAERDRALRAEGAAREQLRAALLSEAKATRFTSRKGQRFDALEAIGRAAAIRPGLDARNEAIAALTLPDWTPEAETGPLWAATSPFISSTPLPGYDAFIHEDETGVFTRRTFPAGAVVWTWPGVGSARAGATVVSPDGRWLAARLQNDEIHVLAADTGKPLFKLTNRTFAFKASRIWGYGTDMAFSADGALFAATRPEGGVTIHRLPDGAQTAAWDTPEWITSVAFAHAGTRLAAGGSKDRGTNLLAVIDAATGHALARESSRVRVDFVEWSADDRWLAVGTKPLQVRAADLSPRTVLPENRALHARFLPDGQRLLVSEQIGQTRLWDIDRGRVLLEKRDSGRPGVWFDGDPLRQWRYFAAGRVVLQTLHDTAVLRAVSQPIPGYTVPAIANPLDGFADGRWLVLGGWSGPSFLDSQSGEWIRSTPGQPEGSASTARLDPDEQALWVGQSKGPLRRHPLRRGPGGRPELGPGEVIPGHDAFLPTAMHRASSLLALSDYYGGRYRLLDTRTRRTVAEWPMPQACQAAFSPDGALLLTLPDGKGSQSEVRETRTGRLVHAFAGAGGQTGAWSPDGQWLLVSEGAEATRLWRAADWTAGPALPAEAQGAGRQAAFSPDSRLLAVNENGFIWLLRVATGEEVARLAAPDQNHYSPTLRFSPDGRTLIVPRIDGSVHLWSLAALRAELAKLGLDWKD